ncbi:MAG: flagellar basal-body MS-ring/collar protein FliF, partial [Rhodocyclaceae bacterium]
MAETTAAPPAPVQGFPLPAPLRNFNQLPMRNKVIAMVAASALIAALVGAWIWARQPDYAVLFSNVSDQDGGAIVTTLTQQNVPYKFAEGGGAIMVPANQVHDLRLRLAAQGLPKGGMVGFELMEGQKLGISQFAEQVNYQRALEGELARSIQSLAAVKTARVHLAIPKQTAFLRDPQKPTASVLVNLQPGRSLDAAQVAGIVHLVSSSVPLLEASSVAIVDQNGKLMSGSEDPARNAGLDPTQINYVQEIEQSYIRRIEAILAPVVGPKNVRAQVAADIDFSQTEQTAENYKPNGTPETAALRSTQSVETTSREPGAAGVPGALSNQPPVPATAPLTTPPAPGTPAGKPGQPAAPVQPPINTHKESTVNYEVDKTIRHVRQPMGTIKRLSVAVVVNHRQVAGADGKVAAKPLGEPELKQINDLTREAMGFNKDRGDTLNVANTPFDASGVETLPDLPLWKDPTAIALAREIGKYLAFALLAAWIYFGVVKPYLRKLSPEPEVAEEEEGKDGEAVAALEGPDGTTLALPPGDMTYEQKLEHARQTAKDDPKMVANIILDWV